ncbi:MAG: adenylyl-sulfate kinase [Verrucomicrobia bacterium]|nr:adenylyl-sulfate kinase [Verrucomicrobiota bacterium]
MKSPENIHPIFDKQSVQRSDREMRLRQRAKVLWLCGLSGSGKSTLALALEKKLFDLGYFPYLLDGDNIRTGLNRNLGFSDSDRTENLRRIAEVAKLFLDAGVVVLTSFITPLESQRSTSKSIIGESNYLEIFVDAPLSVCEQRDVKGLYAKAKAGTIPQFTGKSSDFIPPAQPHLHLKTSEESIEESLEKLLTFTLNQIHPKGNPHGSQS